MPIAACENGDIETPRIHVKDMYSEGLVLGGRRTWQGIRSRFGYLSRSALSARRYHGTYRIQMTTLAPKSEGKFQHLTMYDLACAAKAIV